MSVSRHRRPELRIELPGLGTVDPFRLVLAEDPPGAGEFVLRDPQRPHRTGPLEGVGLNLVGAGQALLQLSVRWMEEAEPPADPPEGPGLPPFGEVRLLVRAREARLLAALLRRHLARLPQPPPWMPDLLRSLEQIREFLRWEAGA